jgi:hypothetical protein
LAGPKIGERRKTMSSSFIDARRGRPRSELLEIRYLTAEVCLNGHPTTDAIERWPERTAKFCAECGVGTIRECPACNVPIRGYHQVPGVILGSEYHPPNHCHNCGTAFPWTTAKIAAAKEHAAEIEGLDDAEKAKLQGAIADLAAGGARTELAASRFKGLMKKAGQTVGSSLYKIVVDVASEAAKKALTGP